MGCVCYKQLKVPCKDRYLINSIGHSPQSLIRVSGKKNWGLSDNPTWGFFHTSLLSRNKHVPPKSIYVFFFSLISFFPFAWAYPLCVPRWKRTKVRKEVVVGVEERKVVWSVLHSNRVSHQKEKIDGWGKSSGVSKSSLINQTHPLVIFIPPPKKIIIIHHHTCKNLRK